MRLEAGALEVGQVLYFRRDAVADGARPWSTSELLYQATLVGSEGVRVLEWVDPSTGEPLPDSASLLAARILHRLGRRSGELSSAGINGMHYWTVDGEISLRDLGAEAGVLDRSSRHIDRNALRSLCATIPAGTWTTYGDVAGAIGVPGAAQSVAGVLATDHSIPNAHRVLRSTGRISPGFVTADGGGPDIARSRLEEEGVSFGANDAADSRCRWSVPPPS